MFFSYLEIDFYFLQNWAGQTAQSLSCSPGINWLWGTLEITWWTALRYFYPQTQHWHWLLTVVRRGQHRNYSHHNHTQIFSRKYWMDETNNFAIWVWYQRMLSVWFGENLKDFHLWLADPLWLTDGESTQLRKLPKMWLLVQCLEHVLIVRGVEQVDKIWDMWGLWPPTSTFIALNSDLGKKSDTSDLSTKGNRPNTN